MGMRPIEKGGGFFPVLASLSSTLGISLVSFHSQPFEK